MPTPRRDSRARAARLLIGAGMAELRLPPTTNQLWPVRANFPPTPDPSGAPRGRNGGYRCVWEPKNTRSRAELCPNEAAPARAASRRRPGGRVVGRPLDTSTARPRASTNPVFGVGLRGFGPLAKGALALFAVAEPAIGPLVVDCPVFRTDDWSARAALPVNAIVHRDGKQKADVSGKRQFAPIIEWRSPELGNRFSAAVIALIEEACPGTLSEAAP